MIPGTYVQYRATSPPKKKQNAWYQRALRCQLRGRPFHPWAGRLRFSGEAHPGPATLTQSSSFSCGAYTAPSLTGRGMLLVRGLPLRVGGRPMRHGRHTHSNVRVTTKAPACNCWGTDSDTSTPCVDEPRRRHVHCCTAVTAVVCS